jgi:hypothetical protein
MRTTTVVSLVAFVLAVGVAAAQEPPQPIPQQPPSRTGPQKPAMATKEFAAQVVSTDQQAKTITVKKEGAAGAEATLLVEASAIDALKTVNAGDKVKLVCKTDNTGKETSVTAIRAAEKPKDKPPY